MCYCNCNCYGYGYGFNSDWMAAAWGLNMLSNMLRDTVRPNNRQGQVQSSNNGNSGNAGNSGNVNHGGNPNSVFTNANNSTLCGDLLTNPNANSGGSLFNYLPGTNQFGYGGMSEIPTDYIPSSNPCSNMYLDNSNLGGLLDSYCFGGNSYMDMSQIPGLSAIDTTNLMPIPSLLDLVMPQTQTQQQAQPQAQAQAQAQTQPQAQAQLHQSNPITQPQPQRSVQPTGQSTSALSNVTTPYTGTAADLDAKLGGVLAGKGQVFLNAQQQYGINAAVLASMCMHESANGTSPLSRTKNNVGGVRIAGSTEFRTYNSVDDCIMHIAKFLKSSYINQGLTTIAQIGAKYCPTNDPTDRAGLNAGWGAGVTRWFNQSFA